jgi:hypothetical protein
VLGVEERQARVADPADDPAQHAERDHAEPRREAGPLHPSDGGEHAEPGADDRGGAVVGQRQNAFEPGWNDRPHGRDRGVDGERRAHVSGKGRGPDQARPARDEHGDGERPKREQRRGGRLVGDERARQEEPDLALAGGARAGRQRAKTDETGSVCGRHAGNSGEDG